LANSREKTEGSLLSWDQVIVTEPPDEGFWEVTCKLDSAEAKGRKKRTLYRKSEKENRLCAKKDDEYLRTRAGCIRLY
jgi:hypothetical protein